MIQFILTDILMISLGVMLYLVARSLPRVEEEQTEKQNIFERWVSSELPEKFDVMLNNFLLKFLRRLKVALLKADNFITKHLKKIAPNGNGGGNGMQLGESRSTLFKSRAAKPKIDFKNINGSGGEVDPVRNQED